MDKHLVVIGNGFDLSHGINSGYEHFILNYLYKCLHELNKYENLKTDELNCSLFYNKYSNELIHLETKSWTDVGNVNEGYNTRKREWYKWFMDNQTENLQELFEQLKTRKIIKFSKNEISLIQEILNSKNINGWIDLEVLYFDLLIEIKKSSIYSIENFDKQWFLLKKEFIKYLRLTLEHYYSSPYFNKNFKNFKYQYVFSYLFDGYTLGYTEKKPNFDNYYFLNFNYTDLINEKYDWNSNQIHGSLDLGTDFNDFLFGYGNTQNKNYNSLKEERSKGYFKNLKHFYYSNKNNKTNLFNWVKSSGYKVKLIGHSCGESDRTLLNELLSHDNCKSIKIYSRDKSDFESIRDNIGKFEKFENYISDKIIPFEKLENHIISQFCKELITPVINKSYIENNE